MWITHEQETPALTPLRRTVNRVEETLQEPQVHHRALIDHDHIIGKWDRAMIAWAATRSHADEAMKRHPAQRLELLLNHVRELEEARARPNRLCEALRRLACRRRDRDPQRLVWSAVLLDERREDALS